MRAVFVVLLTFHLYKKSYITFGPITWILWQNVEVVGDFQVYVLVCYGQWQQQPAYFPNFSFCSFFHNDPRRFFMLESQIRLYFFLFFFSLFLFCGGFATIRSRPQ